MTSLFYQQGTPGTPGRDGTDGIDGINGTKGFKGSKVCSHSGRMQIYTRLAEFISSGPIRNLYVMFRPVQNTNCYTHQLAFQSLVAPVHSVIYSSHDH